MRVLVVDDDDELRRVLHASLTRVGGMQVREAGSAREGLAAALSDPPDVVLLDVRLTDEDGAALLEALRAQPATRSVPVVFLTAETRADEITRLRGLGAAAVLTKPFDPLTLPERLRAALAASQAEPSG